MRSTFLLTILLLSMNESAQAERLLIPLQDLCEVRRQSEAIGERIAAKDIAQGRLRTRVLKDAFVPPNRDEMRILQLEVAVLMDMGIEASIQEQSDEYCGEGQVGGYFSAMEIELERRHGPHFREATARKALARYRSELKSPTSCKQIAERVFCREPMPNRPLEPTRVGKPPPAAQLQR